MERLFKLTGVDLNPYVEDFIKRNINELLEDMLDDPDGILPGEVYSCFDGAGLRMTLEPFPLKDYFHIHIDAPKNHPSFPVPLDKPLKYDFTIFNYHRN